MADLDDIKEGKDFGIDRPQQNTLYTLKGCGSLDWSMLGLGVAVGIAVILVDLALRKSGKGALPPLAVGLGIYLPPTIGLTLTTGAVLGWCIARAIKAYAQRGGKDWTAAAEERGLLLASGLIVGESLMGLLLAVGMLVDNAVVVVESIYQEREKFPNQPEVASIIGTRHVAIALSAGTRWQLAGALREAWWEARLAAQDANAAQRRRDSARQQEADVALRVQAGELARLALNQASSARMQAEADWLRARSQQHHSLAQYL